MCTGTSLQTNCLGIEIQPHAVDARTCSGRPGCFVGNGPIVALANREPIEACYDLVAKEFVAARDDEHGVIVLSCFAGASRDSPTP